MHSVSSIYRQSCCTLSLIAVQHDSRSHPRLGHHTSSATRSKMSARFPTALKETPPMPPAPPPYEVVDPNTGIRHEQSHEHPLCLLQGSPDKIMHALPMTIWAQILTHLDAPARAVLCLSSSELYRHRPKDCFIFSPHTDYLDFLLLMDRDLPSHRLCSSCKTFHPRRDGDLVTCRERYVILTQRVTVPWNCIQLAMRTEYYRKPDFGSNVAVQARSWHELGWTYTLTYELANRKLLLLLRAEKSLQYLRHPNKSAPARLHDSELQGLPICYCHSSCDNRNFLHSIIQCRISHDCDQVTNTERRPSNPGRSCHACKHPLVCEECRSDWRTSLHVERRGDFCLDYDGILTIDRMIDAGPIELAVSQDQFSDIPHPAYMMPRKPVGGSARQLSGSAAGQSSGRAEPATLNSAKRAGRDKMLALWIACGKTMLRSKC